VGECEAAGTVLASMFVYQEGSHFISCLQLADQNLRQKQKDETNLRWIIVALHDALYALLIEKLSRTDGFGIFTDKFECDVSAFYESGGNSDSCEFRALCQRSLKENIAGISKLLVRADLPSGATIHVSDIDTLTRPSKGLSQLKELRDFFSHPRPMISGYYEDFLHTAIQDTIHVINEVRKQSGHTADRHDALEANILMESIQYYSNRWLAQMNQGKE